MAAYTERLPIREPLVLVPILCLTLAGVSCSHVVYQPTPVVPTATPLPYSAKVKLTEVESYLVEPGSTMIADPRIENHVTGVSPSLGPTRKDWEQSIAEYLAARKTFTYLSTDSQTDLYLSMRLNIYIDPGLLFQYNHVYFARVEAALADSRNGRPFSTYLGVGKAAGAVSRGGPADDQKPINVAVQSALNDLFGKIENDARLRR